MNRIGMVLFLIFCLSAAPDRYVSAQAGPVIISPRPGEVLQGVVAIKGSSDVPGFQSSEVSFGYAGDTTGTWFLIASSNRTVVSDTLTTWDTTTITDGNYTLRLRVTLNDGSHLESTITDLRVRNYTPIETPTPAPTALKPTSVTTATLTVTPFPTPTALPTNSAILTPADVSTSLAYGGLGAVLLLVILGIYLWLRWK